MGEGQASVHKLLRERERGERGSDLRMGWVDCLLVEIGVWVCMKQVEIEIVAGIVVEVCRLQYQYQHQHQAPAGRCIGFNSF